MNTLTDNHTMSRPFFGSVLAMCTSLILSGCYVEVSHELEANDDTDSHYSAELDDYSTRFLVDATLIPIALATESGAMVIDPDSYTTPRSRHLTRAAVIETTYAYLFDDWTCDNGGYTETEAEANTTRYDDGYTHVDIWLDAAAHNCETVSLGVSHRINSALSYDVSGWHDDWEARISSLEADLSGWVNVSYDGRYIAYRQLSMQAVSASGNDIVSTGNARVELDDGFDTLYADFETHRNVHLQLGETLPHAGSVEFRNSGGWVTLTFEDDGVWRRDSFGRDRFIRWTTLY